MGGKGKITHEWRRGVMKFPKGFSHQVKIGSGAFSNVWRARQQKLDRDVVLKIIPLSRRAEAAAVEQEAHTVAAVQLSCVPAVYDVMRVHGGVVIVMEWIEGVPLSRLQSFSPGVEVYQKVADEIVSAVGRLHKAGFSHRDLKPENVMVTSDRGVVLVDFGFSRRVTIPNRNGSSLQGTPAYMAPELWVGDAAVDLKKADLYSLGMLLSTLPGLEEAQIATLLETDPSRRPVDGCAFASEWKGGGRKPLSYLLKRELDVVSTQYTAELLFSGAKELHAGRRQQEAYELLTESLSLWPDYPAGLAFLKSAFSGPWTDRRGTYTVRIGIAAVALLLLALAYFIGRGSVAPKYSDAPGYMNTAPHLARVKPAGASPAEIRQNERVAMRQVAEGEKFTGVLSVRIPDEKGALLIDGARNPAGSGDWHTLSLQAGSHRIEWIDSTHARRLGETVDILPFATRRITFERFTDE